MATDREYDATAGVNLTGFSSNATWDDFNSLWSHHPDQVGPKEGFHDPVEAGPEREQLWQGGNELADSDDVLPRSF